MPELLVIVENLLDRQDPGIFIVRIFLLLIGLVPIEDATHKRRDQSCLGLCTRNGLIEVEEERHVALDSLLLQDLSRLNPLPRRCDFDQNPLLGHPLLGVKSDSLVGFGNGPLDVEGETSVHLRAHVARNNLGDLRAEGNSQPVCSIRNLLLHSSSLSALDRCLHQRAVLGVAYRCQDERRVRRRVLRLQAADAVQIACVGNDLCDFRELLSARWHV
mmetsp:Transcript_31352/g.100568  ORF Transcript_31352/g.100568 Transcript_31352/m.100568 type:complete len:217 (-) Transcript_31352:62-712(-)